MKKDDLHVGSALPGMSKATVAMIAGVAGVLASKVVWELLWHGPQEKQRKKWQERERDRPGPLGPIL
ncbi:hypothetical protein JL101_035500 (plasmid) [Skermanella rosea]|uniref:hypothetical protein n=1 Tax=Skermanella rosea TaxID=1817965 RepID=UPI001931972B|nr:hypothetical protein [Skermanella rosea]UEM08105.1 hypothetical protein JL101_035500 [Skermanella rosea]